MKKAIIFFAFITSLILFVMICSPLVAIHFIICTSIAAVKKEPYCLNVFIAYDQLVNAMFAPLLNRFFGWPVFEFGWPDETISSVIGKNLFYDPVNCHGSFRIIDRWLSKLDPHSKTHSKDSIEQDEGEIK